ncbi:MAG: OmpA family protein [Flavobacteriales bacterium]|nr:OmpA family protein [Flavobacteriales bacterium]
MNRKLLFSFGVMAVLTAISFTSNAQNASNKFGIEINGGIREYGGDRQVQYFLAVKPNYQAIGGSLGYKINKSFDGLLFGSVGDLGARVGAFPRQGFTAHISDVMFGLRYKFANDKFMSELSRIKPYLQAGYGGMKSISKIYHDHEGYSPNYINNRVWYAAHWAAGGGVRIELIKNIDLSLQMLYNYSYDDNYDGYPFSLSRVKLNATHDAYLYSSAGFVYNFVKDVYVPKQEEEVPKEIIARVELAAKNIHFETASSTIKTESYPDLDTIVEILLDNPTLQASVEGHTDNVGDDAANQVLSQKRADAVKAYLIGKGVDAARITATGYGETVPVATNDTPEGRALNRRVEVRLSYKK